MRYLLGILILVLNIACSEPADESSTAESPNPTTTLDKNEEIPKNAEQTTPNLKQQQKCAVKGEMLEENELWLKDQGKMVCIIADSSTYDANLGMSHRILEIYNTYTCSLELKLTLPVNVSPDFPYYLADINYNNESEIVAIKAAKTVYCLDLGTQKMLPLLAPKFKTKRAEADPSSGTIIRLELWENFLVGYAQDKGTFVFDLSSEGGAKPVLPFAEYQLGDTRFNSLFLLPSNNSRVQAILPNYDWDEETFSINPIFQAPIALETNVQKSALDNQYLVLRHSDKKEAIIVDMKAKKKVPLPSNMLQNSTKEILEWVRKKS